jgi:hypothetical protein
MMRGFAVANAFAGTTLDAVRDAALCVPSTVTP